MMAGLTFLICVRSYRRDFFDLFRQQKVTVVGLIALSKTLFSVSEAVTLYATLPGARRFGPSREFVPAPFCLYIRYRADTVSSSRA
jgi:hypothetical protein